MKIKLREITGKLLFAMIIIGFGSVSCTYHTNDYDPLEVPEEVSFDVDIIPIFEAKCNDAGCHNGSIAPNLTRDQAYNSLIKGGYVTDVSVAENNILYQKIDDGGSMYTYASDLERAYIKKWIEDEALDN